MFFKSLKSVISILFPFLPRLESRVNIPSKRDLSFCFFNLRQLLTQLITDPTRKSEKEVKLIRHKIRNISREPGNAKRRQFRRNRDVVSGLASSVGIAMRINYTRTSDFGGFIVLPVPIYRCMWSVVEMSP